LLSPVYGKWHNVSTFTIDDFSDATAALYVPGSSEILITDTEANLLRIAPETKKVRWKLFVGTKDPNMKNSKVILLAVSPDGKYAAVSEHQYNAIGPSVLHIVLTSNGKKVKDLKETSEFYFKNETEEIDFRCPAGVTNPKPSEYPCSMDPYKATFASDGTLLVGWQNYSDKYGLYDMSFRAYSPGTFDRQWTWQAVSDNRVGERAGFGNSLPQPVIAQTAPKNFIYADPDYDIRTLNRAAIDVAAKEPNVVKKKPGLVFAKQALEESGGFGAIAVRGNSVHVMGYSSGGYAWFTIYDLQSKKMKFKWVQVSSAYQMSVNPSGNLTAIFGGDNAFFDSKGKKVYEISRAQFIDLNPVDEGKAFSLYGNEFTLYQN